MTFNAKIDLPDPAIYEDTASRLFCALEYLARVARGDGLATIASHIDAALEASLNDYVEERRAILAAARPDPAA
jgi:hypothetical protein